MIFETGFEVCVVFHKMVNPVLWSRVGWGRGRGVAGRSLGTSIIHGSRVHSMWEKESSSEKGAPLGIYADTCLLLTEGRELAVKESAVSSKLFILWSIGSHGGNDK